MRAAPPNVNRAPAYHRGVVLVLAVSDEIDDALCADVRAVRAAQLIVACGDLPFDYLGRLMNLLGVPLVFVPGNHDPDVSGYRTSRAGLPLRAGLPAREVRYPEISGSWLPGTNTSGTSSRFISRPR